MGVCCVGDFPVEVQVRAAAGVSLADFDSVRALGEVDTAAVVSASGNEGLLWRNGILRVRIMWTISVCESNPSTNQPDWKRDWRAGVFALKTKNSRANVA